MSLSVQQIAVRVAAAEPVPYIQCLSCPVEEKVIDTRIATRTITAACRRRSTIRWHRRDEGQPTPGDVVRLDEARAQTVVVGDETTREALRGRVFAISPGLHLRAYDAAGVAVVTCWLSTSDPMTKKNILARMADTVRARGLRWLGDPAPALPGAPSRTRHTCRRAAVGSGPVPVPWRKWGAHGLDGHGRVILCSAPDASVPVGYREVLRGELSDWYAWVAPDHAIRDDAPAQWMSACDGAITSRHNHVVLRPCEGGWLAWVGLGSRMVPVRGGSGRSGCRFASRETARAAALAHIRSLRREVFATLRSRLDGWADEAVSARLFPSDAMRSLSGWEGLSNRIAIHVQDLPASSGSSRHPPVVEEVSDPLALPYSQLRSQRRLIYSWQSGLGPAPEPRS